MLDGRTPLRVAGFFAGIGGIELGLARAGHVTKLLCENDPAADAVLKKHFPGVLIRRDVRTLRTLPEVGLITAGFPCQDLSQAGNTVGIDGGKSGLIKHLFRLLRTASNPEWILLENVPFMLQLDRGRAMTWLTEEFENLGYRWAYRTIDSRSFGLPHRRRRVLFLASRHADPRDVLFTDERVTFSIANGEPSAFGFYWTEGNTGIGWAKDAVPTLKGGSGIGIPSAPAIWIPETSEFGVPHVCDGERLQGFPENWTKVQVGSMTLSNGARWRLIGNAVSVPVSEWLGRRLSSPGQFDTARQRALQPHDKWPAAAFGESGRKWKIEISEYPCAYEMTPLREFLNHKIQPLSYRAAKGFFTRFDKSKLKKDSRFIHALEAFVRAQELPTKFSSTPTTTRKMGSVRQSATSLEGMLEDALRSCNMSFEKNALITKGVRTKPDIIFREKKLAVYIDGCFWHSCPHHATQPKSNSKLWQDKLQANVERDRANNEVLRKLGWKVLRFWGHQDPSEMVHKIESALRTG